MNNSQGNYDHRKIEPKWIEKWEKEGLFKAIDPPAGGPKKYILFEFPYPSGERLHIGHAFSFTGTDVFARYHRMKGFNVLCPMGWDAFGLPAENYAIKTGINPAIITAENIANSKVQAKSWALSIDWDREISTTDPKYYQWTQWIFLQWYKNGLAYKAEMPINWCPKCKIGLANEEVVSGKCERCGAEVTRRRIKQWIVKITAYADRLIEGLKNTAFIEKVKAAQVNWIGRSEGAEIDFTLKWEVRNEKLDDEMGSGKRKSHLSPQFPVSHFQHPPSIKVFTTRPDTLYGATFMVICPEHQIVDDLMSSKFKVQSSKLEEIRGYVEKARKKSEIERAELAKEKTGVFSGLYAINPATGKEIPIWISDFVLSTYGTGAIMAVPAHDERDFAFAKKFGLPIVPVIMPEDRGREGGEGIEGDEGWNFEKGAYSDVDKGITVNSPEWNGIFPNEAIKRATEWIEKKGIGKKTVSYHLRDWIFSRQHYWGEPIPMIFCEKCKSEGQGGKEGPEGQEMAGWWPVPEEDLPVELPKVEKYQPTETGESPLAEIKEWVETKCPVCGGPAKRETDTMPNWAGSDWYYLAYPLAGMIKNLKLKIKNSQNIFESSENILSYWLPVDVYVGGDEHNTLHLLYSRFTYQFLWDIGAMPKEYPEPYFKRLSHGVILGPDGQRMSKSRGNVINPDEISEAFGVDALRAYLMFMGPFESTMAWSQESLEGCSRFIKRVWNLALGNGNTQYAIRNTKLERKLNQTIKKVGGDIEKMKFNTAVAAMMELVNEMYNVQFTINNKENKNIFEKFLVILAPFAPYITEELWERLGNKGSIHEQKWPEYDPGLIAEEVVTIAIQINGKLRSTIELQSDKASKQQSVEEEARKDQKVKKYLEGSTIKKVIYVQGKLVNFVI